MSFVAIATTAATVASTYISVQGQRSAAKAAEMSAEWNADQARKQAKFEEETAQENMRRKRENNRRAIARQRAMGARSGLTEAGAVGDMLVDKSERLQQDVDDLWKNASTRSEQLRGQAQMSLWEGKQAKQASKYAIYGTIAKGVAGAATSGAKAYGNYKAAQPPKAIPVSE